MFGRDGNGWLRAADEHYAAVARIKRSPKMTTSWTFAMVRLRGGIFHSFLGSVQDQIEQFGSGIVDNQSVPRWLIGFWSFCGHERARSGG
jgi:hypothetical protein